MPVINATLGSARSTASAAMTLPARLTWKDANGAVRFTSVRTREVSDTGAVVECDAAVALPLYRLVHLQVEKAAREGVELRSRCAMVSSSRRCGRWRPAGPPPERRVDTPCAS